MLNISVENYNNAGVHIIQICNRRSFWVRMIHVQKVLVIKNISHLAMKKIHGILTTKNPTKEQIRKHKRSGKEWFDYNFYVYVRSNLMSIKINSCRGKKGRGERKIDKFRIKLRFKLNDIPISKN